MLTTRQLPLMAIMLLWSFAANAADWPEFMGPRGRGLAADQAIRTRWSESEGIAWKTELPGRGASSPIVVGDLVVVTASSGSRQDQLHILAIDRATGRTVWHRRFWATGRTLVHPTSAVAAGTPASDGQRIVALYSSCDLIAVDLAGRLLWQRNLAVEHPRSGNDVGMGSSPRIIDGTAVVQIDCQGDAFALGVDAATGEDRWIVPREKLASWTSPLAVTTPGRGECVLLQNPQGLDLRLAADGKQVWSWKGKCEGIPMTAESAAVMYVPGDGMSAVAPSTADAQPSSPAESPVRSSGALRSPASTGRACSALAIRQTVSSAGRSASRARSGPARSSSARPSSPLIRREKPSSSRPTVSRRSSPRTNFRAPSRPRRRLPMEVSICEANRRSGRWRRRSVARQ